MTFHCIQVTRTAKLQSQLDVSEILKQIKLASRSNNARTLIDRMESSVTVMTTVIVLRQHLHANCLQLNSMQLRAPQPEQIDADEIFSSECDQNYHECSWLDKVSQVSCFGLVSQRPSGCTANAFV
jgi:hypothetical protein